MRSDVTLKVQFRFRRLGRVIPVAVLALSHLHHRLCYLTIGYHSDFWLRTQLRDLGLDELRPLRNGTFLRVFKVEILLQARTVTAIARLGRLLGNYALITEDTKINKYIFLFNIIKPRLMYLWSWSIPKVVECFLVNTDSIVKLKYHFRKAVQNHIIVHF